MVTHTRTHVHVSFANPHLVCEECGQLVVAFHDPDRCGHEGPSMNLPCQHNAAAVSTCPSWSPVDGCQCASPHRPPSDHALR